MDLLREAVCYAIHQSLPNIETIETIATVLSAVILGFAVIIVILLICSRI